MYQSASKKSSTFVNPEVREEGVDDLYFPSTFSSKTVPVGLTGQDKDINRDGGRVWRVSNNTRVRKTTGGPDSVTSVVLDDENVERGPVLSPVEVGRDPPLTRP